MRGMMWSMANRLFLIVCLGFVVAGFGCEDRSYTRPDPQTKRVVSLSPAITQILIDLDQAERLVGVAANDPAAPDGLPVLGRFPDVDYEALVQAQPTDVFIQPSGGNVPDRLLELSREHGWRLHTYQFRNVKDVLDALYDPTATNQYKQIGGALDIPLTAGDLAARIQERLEALAKLTAEEKAPRVLLLHALDPPGAVGPKTFLDDLLAFAGGLNVLFDAEEDYPVLDRETIVALKPDVIILLGQSGSDALPPLLKGLDIPAVRDKNIGYLDDPLALLPSSSMPRVTAKLTKLLHPTLADRVDRIMQHDDAP